MMALPIKTLELHYPLIQFLITGSLSTRVFETRTATGRENFACQDSVVSQIFVLIISNGEKILSIVNVVERKQVKRENNSLPVAVRVSKTCVLKLPNISYPTRAHGIIVKKSISSK